MDSIPNDLPLSLRAWPQKDDSDTTLSLRISRINFERGSFRNVTEESLEEEIQRSEAGVEAANVSGESDEEGVKDEDFDKSKDLATAREKLIGQLEQAHNAAMVALDFVSLVLSKDTPVPASLSISPALRDAVALGTLGVDKIHDSRVTKAQRDSNRRIAKGWKIQSLNRTVDSILASATRLEKEIESETKYWEQVLAIDEKGWAICRIPQERHTLGVRFGFLEAAPAFRNRSLGALRRNNDESVDLDQGIADPTPKRVRVRIQSGGLTIAEASRAPANLDSSIRVRSQSGSLTAGETSRAPATLDLSIETLILQARNAIFEEELWQELNREARTLASHGVRLDGDCIMCPMTTTKHVVLDLVPIEEQNLTRRTTGDDRIAVPIEKQNPTRRTTRDDRIAADMIAISLRLLLSYAHRQNLHRRSQRPPPISNRPSVNPPYILLRPVIARLHHQLVISTLKNLLSPLSKILVSTGMADTNYTLNTTPIATHNAINKPVPEQTIETLISNMSAEFKFPICSKFDQSLFISQWTTISPSESYFQITASGVLATICKPPPNSSSVDEVRVYILWAVACALAASFADPNPEDSGDTSTQDHRTDAKVSSLLHSGLCGWRQTHNPTVLRKLFKNEKHSKELSFAAVEENGSVQIHVTYKFALASSAPTTGIIKYIWKAEGTKSKPLSQVVDEAGKWPGPRIATASGATS